MSDQNSFSLQYQCNIKQKSDEDIFKYQEAIVSWSNTKFSRLTSQDLDMADSKENY